MKRRTCDEKGEARKLSALVLQSKKLAADEEIDKATKEVDSVCTKMSELEMKRDEYRRRMNEVGTVPGEVLAKYQNMNLKTVCEFARSRASFECKLFVF